MWLILCSAHDAHARWAYEGLGARGLAPLELVSAESLVYALRWEHRLDSDDPRTSITLRDGRNIELSRVRGVLNRLTHVPLGHLSRTPDHDYFSQEFTAFFMSWLHALAPPVLNPTAPQGLCGRWRHASEWAWLAGRAGLTVPAYRQSSADGIDETRAERKLFPEGAPLLPVFVVGDRVLGGPDHPPPDVRDGSLRLAELSETPLLGLHFSRGAGGGWAFASATPLPELIAGGPPLLDALAAALTAGREVAE